MQMNKLFNTLMLVLIAISLSSCHKELNIKDPVVSNEEMAMSGSQARFSWCVDFTEPFQTGVELSPNEDMTELRRVEATKKGDKYVAVVEGLSMGMKYYYRIVVWDKLNNYEQEVKSFTTSPTFTVTLACNPEEGGSARGDGTYIVGDTCTVAAAANVGYDFVSWTENGNQVSTDSEYGFTVTDNRNLVSNFSLQEYEITLMTASENGGTVSGGGTYKYGQICTITATANAGYIFVNWTENGNKVSNEVEYCFTVTENCQIVANFTLVPTGAIKGLFTVDNEGNQVFFSQGNLQYIKSTNVWSFMEHQYDIVETYGDVGLDYVNHDTVSLFGWGTSGCNLRGTETDYYYQPYNTNTNYRSYGPLGDYDLTGEYANGDWGVYNCISNGGNTANTWRVLTEYEWRYVFNIRNTPSRIRYAMAQVNGVDGVILLPDDWKASTYNLTGINTINVSYDCNEISAQQWEMVLEPAGAVFFPAAGERSGTNVYSGGCYYWSASSSHDSFAKYMPIPGHANTTHSTGRELGMSVRLVCSVQ